MKTYKFLYIPLAVFYIFFFSNFYFFGAAYSQENNQAVPEWWDQVDVEVERKANVVEQYYDIKRNLLDNAYRAEGDERATLLKKSIKAYSKLLEWFTSNQDMPTACLADYQIAEAYKQMGDAHMAKTSYEKCLTYRRFVNDPPTDSGDTTIIAIINSSAKKLESFR